MMNYLVVAHDAGGAEIVSSWVKHHEKLKEFSYLLEGPAVNIFSRKLGEVENLTRSALFTNLFRYDRVLTGTGWASDLERLALKTAKQSRTTSATYLDHWFGYGRRFLLDGQMVLPDELWVGDSKALQIARQEFPGVPVKLEPNLYFKEMVDAIRELSSKVSVKDKGLIRILYVTEPTSHITELRHSDPNHFGYTEFEALESYLKYLKTQNYKNIEKIRIRRHPAEQKGKYSSLLAGFSNHFPIEEDLDTSLVEDCAWADWVVGCQSMAMVIALLAGKKVFSCIPERGKLMPLPFEGITRLFQGAPK